MEKYIRECANALSQKFRARPDAELYPISVEVDVFRGVTLASIQINTGITDMEWACATTDTMRDDLIRARAETWALVLEEAAESIRKAVQPCKVQE